MASRHWAMLTAAVLSAFLGGALPAAANATEPVAGNGTELLHGGGMDVDPRHGGGMDVDPQHGGGMDLIPGHGGGMDEVPDHRLVSDFFASAVDAWDDITGAYESAWHQSQDLVGQQAQARSYIKAILAAEDHVSNALCIVGSRGDDGSDVALKVPCYCHQDEDGYSATAILGPGNDILPMAGSWKPTLWLDDKAQDLRADDVTRWAASGLARAEAVDEDGTVMGSQLTPGDLLHIRFRSERSAGR